MTLALYGKSRQRQTGLILAGIVAVLLGALAGLSAYRSQDVSAATSGTLVAPTSHENDSCDSSSGGNAYGASFVSCDDGESVTYQDFSYAVPANAVVTGIQVQLVQSTLNNNGFLSEDGVYVEIHNGTSFSSARLLDTNDEGTPPSDSDSSGGSSDTWGLSWNVAGANAIKVRVTGQTVCGLILCGSQKAYFDAVQIAIFYTLDADADGVSDGSDQCPNTLDGAPGVDEDGCDYAQQLAPSVATNPARPDTCDVDFSIVIDRSASFSNAERALTLSETQEFIEAVFAIPGNSPTFRIVGFADNAIVPAGTQPYTTETDAVTALNAVGTGTYTNWAAGMTAGNGAGLQWMIVITDGNPNRPGDSNNVTLGALQAAVDAANTVKGGGAHITVVGVDTTGNEPNGFGPISQSYAELVGNGDVLTGGLDSLADILKGLTVDCEQPPTIEKKLVGLNPAGTEASWTVEVKNNSQTTQTFYLVEEVQATLYATANCGNPESPLPVTSAPPTEDPWRCDVVSGGTGIYYLTTPVTFNLCTGGNAVNDYFVRYTGPGSPFDGYVSVEVPGIPQYCDREIIVDKNFVGLGGYVPTLADVPDLSLPVGVTIKSEGFLDADTYRWVLNAPIDASGEVTEVNIPDFWAQVDDEECFIYDLTNPESLVIQEQLIEIPVADCVFENQPFGTLIINKTDGTSDGSVLWDFTVNNLPAKAVDGTNLDSTPQASENTPSQQNLVPLGSGALFVTEDDFRSETACATANTYFTSVIGPNPDQELTFPGDSVVWNFSNQPCGVLGTGGILIEKWEDVNGDGIISAGDQRLPGWTFTTTGTGIPPASQVQVTNGIGQITAHVSGLEAGVVVETFETLQPGWVFVGTDVDGGPMTADESPDVVIVGGETIVVRFLNERARVNIVATKTIFNNANPAGANGGAGWTFTLTGCGQPASQKVTGASGMVSWENLPAAINCTYTVTETAKAGWVADDLQKTAAPLNDGQTVTLGFVNRQIEGCTNINDCPPPTTTTSTPTSTPTTPVTGETPTTEPTATNTPEEDVEGEKTPGPGGEATPVAPDTGTGFGSVSAGWNVLLIIAGLVAISGGLSMIALGRRTVRND